MENRWWKFSKIKLTCLSRKKAMAAAKKVGKKTSAFDNRAGNVWRQISSVCKRKSPC